MAEPMVINTYTFVSLEALRRDQRESAVATFCTALLLVMLLYNVYLAASLLPRTRSRALFIGNLLQPLMGVHAGVVALLRELRPDLVSCRSVVDSNVVVLMVGVPLMLSVLYVKAYYSIRRARWFMLVGLFMIACSVGVGITGFFATETNAAGRSHCRSQIDRSWVWSKCTVDVAANLLLSYGFIAPLYRNCREYKDSLSEALMRDGVLYALAAILSSILCALLTLIPHLKAWQMHIYAADYCIASMLICYHIRSFKQRLHMHHQV